MSNPYLPPEILDHIVEFLHDDPKTLKGCCLVSKSWIPRTRKYLFDEIELRYKAHLRLWKEMFPDPSTSPANFAKCLHVGCASAITTADAEAGGWLTGFTHITHLGVGPRETYHGESGISLIPFLRFSRTIKSLHIKSVDLPPSRIFDFILSSPLLEDLNLVGYRTLVDDDDDSDGPPAFVQPSNPPVLTGSLNLCLKNGVEPVASRLLSIPGGIHFRKLTLTWHREEDVSSIIALVRECSRTLESLKIVCTLHGTSIQYLRSHQ